MMHKEGKQKVVRLFGEIRMRNLTNFFKFCSPTPISPKDFPNFSTPQLPPTSPPRGSSGFPPPATRIPPFTTLPVRGRSQPRPRGRSAKAYPTASVRPETLRFSFLKHRYAGMRRHNIGATFCSLILVARMLVPSSSLFPRMLSDCKKKEVANL